MMKDFLHRLQNLSDAQKKIILILVLVVTALIIGFFGIQSTQKDLAKIQKAVKGITIPSLPASPNENAPNFQGVSNALNEIGTTLPQVPSGENVSLSSKEVFTSEIKNNP